MLVYGLVSPHPPIIVPEIGKDDLPKVRQTIKALQQAVGKLAEAKPERLIIISPHEDHGFEVPEYYLRQQLPEDCAVERILVTEPSYRHYYDYGARVGDEVRATSERTAIVASGDLSHVLLADGPYGFDPAGPELDALITQAIRQADAEQLLHIDPAILEDGAECGLRSILFLLGAFRDTPNVIELLSYEGPFGVGYMVATVAPRLTPSPYVKLARDALDYYYRTGLSMAPPGDLDATLAQPAGAFVSLHQPDGDLRGCIGTIEPTKPNLAAEIIANAIAAATADPRFEPVTEQDYANLTLSVDVLTQPHPADDPEVLDPTTDGVIIEAADGRRGVLLPNLDGVTSVEQQVAICRQKAGIAADEPIKLATFRSTRYES